MHTVRRSGRISVGGGGGVCSRWGGLLRGEGGVSSPGGVCSEGMVSAPKGVVSQHALRKAPPPCGQTDACNNITFATSLRTVIKA